MNVLMSISNEDKGEFTLQKFDKRGRLPFSYTQYIKFSSNKLVKQTCNVIVSQIVSILYLSNNIHLAIHEIETLISTLANNGFYKEKHLH